MATDLTFRFTLDVDDQVRAAALLSRRSRGSRVFRWVGLPFLAVPFLLVFAFDAPLTVLRPWATLVAAVALTAVLVPVIQRWQIKRALAAEAGLQPLTYRFEDQGFSVATPLSSVQLSWDTVQEAVETNDMFVLFVVGGVAYYVPKRAAGEQGPTLARLLRARLGSRASKVRPPDGY